MRKTGHCWDAGLMMRTKPFGSTLLVRLEYHQQVTGGHAFLAELGDWLDTSWGKRDGFSLFTLMICTSHVWGRESFSSYGRPWHCTRYWAPPFPTQNFQAASKFASLVICWITGLAVWASRNVGELGWFLSSMRCLRQREQFT